jgi:condensin-2 complex subunit H2
MADTQEKEKRYAHLLAPIRDMAQNWSIDIAKELEEYMEELDSIKLSFDGGKTTLNFAEAALLIQNSACIYSRKVEYLYGLIFQTLDLLQAQNRRHKVRLSPDRA